MRILVLGGTGAMGASLVPILAERGDEVYVTTRSRREQTEAGIYYLQGNAHDPEFLKELLKERWDVIVDFMLYGTQEFRMRRDLLLSATDQYVFLSSSRVYAGVEGAITEDSPRLLEACSDAAYLQSDDYALAKARQEDLLKDSDHQNWTIIRPYITFNSERLQLGTYEKEVWLYRALMGKTIVFSKDLGEALTTLTYGGDVARAIADMMGNEKALGQTVHITADHSLPWKRVLAIYEEVLREELGLPLKVYWLENAEEIGEVMENMPILNYDRLYDRTFCNQKMRELAGEEIRFSEVETALRACLKRFLEKRTFRDIPWNVYTWMDRVAAEYTPLKTFSTWKEKLRYIVYRYFPQSLLRLRRNRKRP